MILYMVLQRNKDGSTEYRIGGGSSTQPSPRVYETIGRARQYADDRYATYYVVELDTDQLPIVYTGAKK